MRLLVNLPGLICLAFWMASGFACHVRACSPQAVKTRVNVFDSQTDYNRLEFESRLGVLAIATSAGIVELRSETAPFNLKLCESISELKEVIDLSWHDNSLYLSGYSGAIKLTFARNEVGDIQCIDRAFIRKDVNVSRTRLFNNEVLHSIPVAGLFGIRSEQLKLRDNSARKFEVNESGTELFVAAQYCRLIRTNQERSNEVDFSELKTKEGLPEDPIEICVEELHGETKAIFLLLSQRGIGSAILRFTVAENGGMEHPTVFSRWNDFHVEDLVVHRGVVFAVANEIELFDSTNGRLLARFPLQGLPDSNFSACKQLAIRDLSNSGDVALYGTLRSGGFLEAVIPKDAIFGR